MELINKPPLCINFVWHSSDNSVVEPVLEKLRTLIARHPKRPFSRGLNIPLFYYSSSHATLPPFNIPVEAANKNLVFCFLSEHTVGNDPWYEYISNLSSILEKNDNFLIIPIAIDRYAFSHSTKESLCNINYLRYYDWKIEQDKTAVLHIIHEIYRYILPTYSKNKRGVDTSVKLFLSHSKTDDIAIEQAKCISQYVDSTNWRQFFDTKSISPAFRFDAEICNHIEEATFIAFKSDSYSSRHWCQKEILHAKKCQRPIIAVDSRIDFEDRIFPAASNIPCIHIEHKGELSEQDKLRILITSMLETIRAEYTKQLLDYYQQENWIDAECEIATRPPEITQVLEMKIQGKSKVCYPEPPIYSEEAEWLTLLDIDAFTPLWNTADDNMLNGRKIGISISDVTEHDFSTFHIHANHTQRLAQDLARHILARAGTLIYGGDLRQNGFTEFILDEAIALQSRINTDTIHVENHLAWPLYVSTQDVRTWRSKYRQVMKTVMCPPPEDVKQCVDEEVFLLPNLVEHKYVWSRCLTTMRQDSLSSSDARICAAGKLSGYNGKMPGVLEEILLALELKKPLYLLGGFGGVVAEICNIINANGREDISEFLSEQWQINNNTMYYDLQEYAKSKGHHVDYSEIQSLLYNTRIAELAQQAGLCVADYSRLMTSVFTDECVHLVLKGLKNIFHAKVEV